MEKAKVKARHFITQETQFHLGALITEQPHPRTAGLAEILHHNTAAGIRLLQDVDRDVAQAAGDIFTGAKFAVMTAALQAALTGERRIFFSGCGATGRLCVLLEAAWRRFHENLREQYPDIIAYLPFNADSIVSMITGGDFALIRSVESFEDHASFGRRQAQDAGVRAGDVFVGISEGGETSSVIGSMHQALDAGAKVFFIYNNPADILAQHVARSREIIRNPAVTTLELVSGPMAVAGSTRMQATTFELLVTGAALEYALTAIMAKYLNADKLRDLGITVRPPGDFTAIFTGLLDDLGRPAAVKTLEDMVHFEEKLYKNSGLITYFAQDYLLDILTDTTERSPTFMLPPFRKCDETATPVSWAFVKHPALATPDAWHNVLRRPPRCLEWKPADYRAMNAPAKISNTPPKINTSELHKIRIGNETDPSRLHAPWDAAMAVLIGNEVNIFTDGKNSDQPDIDLNSNGENWLLAFKNCAAPYHHKAVLTVGTPIISARNDRHDFNIFNLPCALPDSPLNLWHHLATKLAFNTLSTATMGRMGRLTGNWMTHVDTTNKKLIDRGIRLVAELCRLDYASACEALHATFDELENMPSDDREKKQKTSAVARTIERCGSAALSLRPSEN